MRKLLMIGFMIVAMGLNAKSLQFHVSVTNSWNQEKRYEPVVIKLKDVPGLNFDVQSATVFIGNHSGQIDPVAVIQLACQLDDWNGDQRVDELVFMAEIKANASADYTIELFDDLSGDDEFGKPTSVGDRRWVYADMMLEDKKDKHPLITALEAPGDSYLYNDLYHHGVAFENELCGFRIYFDQRQNIDIYGKKKRQLELAQTNFYTTPEQMKQDFGNDVLWAGNSIGCGSFKGWDGTAPTNIEPVTTRGQRIIAAGPLRTIVEVKDIGWNGLNMRQYYILYAWHRECEVRIEFDRPLTSETFATGVQKIGAHPAGYMHKEGEGIIWASWGSDYPEMGKKEQFPPEAVGLAVYVPKQYIKATPESDLNYLFVLGARGQTSLHYYVAFCADKEVPVDLYIAHRFATLDAPAGYHDGPVWFDAMPGWKEHLEHPVSIKIKK
jgi:hypothetical protein